MKTLKKLAIICGGPSKERGISLNSARSVMDHLKGLSLEIIALFVDSRELFYSIDPNQLYSNTPADFDFKLPNTPLNESSLKAIMHSVDLVFPVIHGEFGEDGKLQAILEKMQIPFVGHSSVSCKNMYPKHIARKILEKAGFLTQDQLVFTSDTLSIDEIVTTFFLSKNLKRALVKPSCGGSSFGVCSVSSPQEASLKIKALLSESQSATILLEPFFTGKEFTVTVLQNIQGKPVALIPTEIELSYAENEIFDTRKKYLPTNLATYHTPPRFSNELLGEIRKQAEAIFSLFDMRDFVRLDGWILHDGSLCFTDINPISGLEQNSFFFRQASLIGLSHKCALEYILNTACHRYQLTLNPKVDKTSAKEKCPVFVLFGNSNAERQVSLMSGTNVWLKLLQSNDYFPIPYFLDPQGYIWELPYSFALNHTVEEIYTNCLHANTDMDLYLPIIHAIRKSLKLNDSYIPSSKLCRHTLHDFTSLAKKRNAFVFIALHGGIGEDGTLQKHFEEHEICFNGCRENASRICMDKFLTGSTLSKILDSEVFSLPKQTINLKKVQNLSEDEIQKIWNKATQALSTERVIIKPKNDGCSAGIVLLESACDLITYCRLFHGKQKWIPAHTFTNQPSLVEISLVPEGEYVLEPYIETDTIHYFEQKLSVERKSGWIELTIGVMEKNGNYHPFNPSITLAEGAILSLEEKFQGGRGINLTPPPQEVIPEEGTKKIKEMTKRAARALNIENYARIDLFFNVFTHQMIVIEANTLPALTPSTVIYHQALAENPPIKPLEFLEQIISTRLGNNSP